MDIGFFFYFLFPFVLVGYVNGPISNLLLIKMGYYEISYPIAVNHFLLTPICCGEKKAYKVVA